MSLQWECCNSDLAFYVRNLKLGHRCHKNNFTRIELKIYFFISDFPESMRLMIVTEKSTSLLVLLFNNLYDHQIQAVISTAKMSCYVSTQLSWERETATETENLDSPALFIRHTRTGGKRSEITGYIGGSVTAIFLSQMNLQSPSRSNIEVLVKN